MNLIDTLDAISAQVIKQQERELAGLFTWMGDLLSDQLLSVLTNRDLDQRDLEKCLHKSHKICNDLDAAYIYQDLMRDKSAADFSDLRITTIDFDRNVKAIDDHLENSHPDRGYIYIAHRRSPRHVFYVGKGSSHARVKELDRHGKLTHALSRPDGARTVTFLFPVRSTSENLSDLEAAVVTLVKWRLGQGQPSLNTKQLKTTAHPKGSLLLELAAKRCMKSLRHLSPVDPD